MKKVWEILGYLVNAGSIALFGYLVSVLDAPDVLAPLRYVGWGLLGSGVVLVALSVITLFVNKDEGLIARGIYGVVRHPMYLGAMLCFLSYVCLHPHWLVLLLSLVNVAVVYAFIVQGDRENVVTFGEAYRRYMERVPRINLLVGMYRQLRNGL